MNDKNTSSGEMNIFERYLTIWVALCIVTAV
jgi:ACR3 family arsenite efflux pump ArsB